MNERIKQLILECVDFRLDPDSNAYEAQVCPEELECLAELIVRECARLVEDSKWNLPRGCTAADQAKYVKEHFGVEE